MSSRERGRGAYLRGAASLLMLLVTACDGSGEAGVTTGTAQAASRQVSPAGARFAQERVAEGGRIFADYCASCHGKLGQGAFNWRQQQPDGRYPPPPLNGSGHAWHHPKRLLRQVILEGRGKMPAWKGKLSDAEIEAVIAWFQSKWPQEIYLAWARNDQRTR